MPVHYARGATGSPPHSGILSAFRSLSHRQARHINAAFADADRDNHRFARRMHMLEFAAHKPFATIIIKTHGAHHAGLTPREPVRVYGTTHGTPVFSLERFGLAADGDVPVLYYVWAITTMILM